MWAVQNGIESILHWFSMTHAGWDKQHVAALIKHAGGCGWLHALQGCASLNTYSCCDCRLDCCLLCVLTPMKHRLSRGSILCIVAACPAWKPSLQNR